MIDGHPPTELAVLPYEMATGWRDSRPPLWAHLAHIDGRSACSYNTYVT